MARIKSRTKKKRVSAAKGTVSAKKSARKAAARKARSATPQVATGTATPKPTGKLPLVGIGASAGGLKAFEAFVENIPTNSGIAWVLIQHMSPDRESMLAPILRRHTRLPIVEIAKATPVGRNCIYVAAPGTTIKIANGTLIPTSDRDPISRRSSIDAFFISLAQEFGDGCGCALLSGAGTDGTLGLKAVKEAGGLTLTQTLGAAEYDSMLVSAVRTGLVDRELPVEDMPEAFADFLARRNPGWDGPIPDGERRKILDVLRSATSHDFASYKFSTVDRRIRRRMQMLGIMHLPVYLKRLQADKAEPTLLFRDMLIGVTQFFRDPATFDAIARDILPKILEKKTADDEIRIWVPGCATGEEAYSLGILLLESVSKLDSVPKLKVFGTDIDDNALHAARLGQFPKSIAADVAPERLQRFFEAEDGTYCVRSQLREVCMFAQHNMLRDPPFSRIDLISCRNVLIYMNAELQQRIMPVFRYALRRDGYLLLGPAESASPFPKIFREIDRKHRIYQRIGEAKALPIFPVVEGFLPRPIQKPSSEAQAPETDLSLLASRRILADHAPAYVVIDEEFEILEASAGTGAYLELAPGKPRFNLRSMARSGLAIDVRAAVSKVIASGRPETREGLRVDGSDLRRQLTLTVEPLPEQRAGKRLYLIVFKENSAPSEQDDGKRARQRDDDVTRALDLELQHTKERLQSTLEELETSNEELKASNEELSSVNEELQSSNEELETSKEELQSINEELRTVNSELGNRVDELDRVNNDLKNLLANSDIAMLFLDNTFHIKNFTPPAKPLFHLRDHDIGRPLDELSGRLTFTGLKKQVEDVIRNGVPHEREVETNGGAARRTFILRVLPYRDQQEKITGAVLTLIDISERKESELQLAGMVSELNHRVKNSLAAVQAILRQTRKSAQSVDQFGDLAEDRIHAMALSHRLLSASDWHHAPIRQVITSVLAPFAESGTERFKVSGPDLELRPSVVVSLGLMLHELATNAAKHGAWSTSRGKVDLDWAFVRNDHGNLVLNWVESGGPPAKEPEQDGFGLRFVRESAQHDLKGSSSFEFLPGGLRCRITMPADAIAWDEKASTERRMADA